MEMRWKTSIFPILVFIMTLLVSIQVLAEGQQNNNEEAVNDGITEEEDRKTWEQEPLELEVVLERKYLDGRIDEEVKTETIWSLHDFWSGYKSWKLMKQEEGRVVFRKEIEELSPAVKENGYFGLTEDNVLSIFNGRPENNEVIKAYYEIDVGKLKSYRVDELKSGIKIEKKSTFQDVMETYKEYASSEPVDDLVDS
ncbi:regulator [Salinibacillus xinjiangensis]|uniref:Regulator n=2 Tax=Salinibacillus xinjiangensis TaxID=1229268 RepID=A0A6G1XBD4_9BACI|nr:regulator [Salinibacillus xinjiangensis]